MYLCQTEIGATAYAQKPLHRVRPNGQFLQATLRSVESGIHSLGVTALSVLALPNTDLNSTNCHMQEIAEWKRMPCGDSVELNLLVYIMACKHQTCFLHEFGARAVTA